jgi:two-component system, cell cycle response regulator DivK
MAHILVVEDDPNNALVFEAVLKRIGKFEVTVSENVDEILSLCRSGKIDLVIMDVSLTQSYYQGKKVDGLEITRLLKNDETAERIPVLLATAHAMKGEKERFLAASGADGYVTKPVLDHHALVRQIGELIQKSKETVTHGPTA